MLSKKIITILSIALLAFSTVSFAGKGGNKGPGSGGNGNSGGGSYSEAVSMYIYGIEEGMKAHAYGIPEENYNAYIGKSLKKCAGLTNKATGVTVYAPGDPRLGYNLCAFTMGLKSGFYGMDDKAALESGSVEPSLDVRRCLESYENRGFFGNSDEVNQKNIQNCIKQFTAYNDNPNVPIYFCPQKNFSEKAVSDLVDVTFSLPGGTYRVGTIAYVPANENGQECINEKYQLSCVSHFSCERKNPGNPLEWKIVSESLDENCKCVPKADAQCNGTPPIGKEYCKCGRWVSFAKYNSDPTCVTEEDRK